MGGSQTENYFLVYLGRDPVREWKIAIPAKDRLDDQPMPTMRAEIIDCWNMTITPIPGELTFQKSSNYYWTCKDKQAIELPGKPWTAIRLTPIAKANQ